MQKQSNYIKNLLIEAKNSIDKTYHSLKFIGQLNSISKEERKEIHESVFESIDCLECGNCCSTTPAIVLKKDIKRISTHLGMSKKQFDRKYLMDDLTGDTIFNHVPCRFLGDDNKCSIYEVRPDACRRFPHTDEDDFDSRPKWNAHNTTICPAAYLIVKKMTNIK